MLTLDRETTARARERQEEIFTEKIHAIYRAERAVKEPRVVVQNRFAAELQRPHRGQHPFRRHRFKRPIKCVAQGPARQPFR